MTAKVVAAIYLQAARLWLKRTPVRRPSLAGLRRRPPRPGHGSAVSLASRRRMRRADSP